MEYYVKSVVPIIESNYDKFTTVERNIADFFIQNRKKVDFSSKSISERLFVSEASLSRFAKKCGYRGYREFIYQYEETFVEKQESITGNTRMILNAYQELLNKTYSLVDEAQIARISRYLNQAERVFVCGTGSSGLAAREMELRFMRIGVDIDSLVERDMMRAGGIPGQKKPRIRNQYQRIQGRGLVSSERSISERCENDSFYGEQPGWLRAVLHRSCSDSITQTPESWECNLTAVPDSGHA